MSRDDQLRRRGAAVVCALALVWALAGCGKKPEEPAGQAGQAGEAAPPGAPPGAEPMPPGTQAPPGAEAPPGAPPGEDVMPGAPGEAAPAEGGAQPIKTAAKPPFPSRPQPFDPLDKPMEPPPPPPPPPASANARNLLPIRANLITPPRQGVVSAPPDDRLPNVRTSGIRWGSTVKAIVQDGSQTYIVQPGDTVPIASPGGRELTVLSIVRDGVRLRNEATGRIYFAPLRGE